MEGITESHEDWNDVIVTSNIPVVKILLVSESLHTLHNFFPDSSHPQYFIDKVTPMTRSTE